MTGITLRTYRKNQTGVTKTGIPREISRAMRGWTKYGGTRNGYSMEVTPEWYCQSCTEKQTDKLPSYLIEIEKENYARICSICFHEAIARKITNVFALISFMRRVVPDW